MADGFETIFRSKYVDLKRSHDNDIKLIFLFIYQSYLSDDNFKLKAPTL